MLYGTPTTTILTRLWLVCHINYISCYSKKWFRAEREIGNLWLPLLLAVLSPLSLSQASNGVIANYQKAIVGLVVMTTVQHDYSPETSREQRCKRDKYFLYHKSIILFNSLWPGDAIWRLGTMSTLAQVMAWCRQAPSHYLNQCWLIIGEVPWHPFQGIILRRCEDTNQ